MYQRGLTIIELAITVAIVGLLLAIGLPNLTAWMSNSQIRTAGETIVAGLSTARTEALRRNATVRFQLASTLDSSCVLSATGIHWIISLADPTGQCDAAPSGTAPQIIQKNNGSVGTPKAAISATGGTVVVFNGLGRLSSPGGVTNITQIDISNPTGGVCQHVTSSGPMRCLRITVSTGGTVKLCDPAVTVTTDPRFC